MEPRGPEVERHFLPRAILISICPLKIKLNLCMCSREGKFWRHELRCGFPSYYSTHVKEKKYSLLFIIVLDGKRLLGWEAPSDLNVEITSKYKFRPISHHSPMVLLFYRTIVVQMGSTSLLRVFYGLNHLFSYYSLHNISQNLAQSSLVWSP